MKKIIILSSMILGVIFLTGCGQQPAGLTSTTKSSLIEQQPTISTTQTGCLHTNMVKFSVTEEARLKEIMVSVMQGDINMPTPLIYEEFWSIMDKYGRLCEEDITLTKDSIAATSECNKLFYQDALISLRTGKSYKSAQRLNCENKTILALLPTDKANAKIKANEDLMLRITNGQPIATATGSIVFTKETIQSTLNDISTKLEGLNRLFSKSVPSKSNSKQLDSEKAVLDKGCEDIHGPSVYVSIPKSDGGGAYCDCKPGYILKPMKTAEGVLSSWCVKK